MAVNPRPLNVSPNFTISAGSAGSGTYVSFGMTKCPVCSAYVEEDDSHAKWHEQQEKIQALCMELLDLESQTRLRKLLTSISDEVDELVGDDDE